MQISGLDTNFFDRVPRGNPTFNFWWPSPKLGLPPVSTHSVRANKYKKHTSTHFYFQYSIQLPVKVDPLTGLSLGGGRRPIWPPQMLFRPAQIWKENEKKTRQIFTTMTRYLIFVYILSEAEVNNLNRYMLTAFSLVVSI